MKKLLIILLIYSSLITHLHAQYIPNTSYYQYPGIKTVYALQPPTGCGLPTAANVPDATTAALYYDKCASAFYGWDVQAAQWKALATEGGGPHGIFAVYAGLGLIKLNDSTLALDTSFTSSQYLRLADTAAMLFPYLKKTDLPATSLFKEGLNQPGYVSWRSGLIFDVTPAIYTIGGITYNSAAGSVTLNPADATYGRYDIIGVDNTGAIVKITGTPSPSPALPQIDPASQVVLTSVFIPALATSPGGITQNIIYDENTEPYNHTPTGVTVDYNNTTSPFHGAKDMLVGSSPNSATIDFTRTTGVDTISKYTLFVIYIKLIDTIPTNAYFRFAFFNGATQVSNYLLARDYGFKVTDKTNYQAVIIPVSAFTFSSTTFNKLRIWQTGKHNGQYMDYIQLQSGTPPATTQETDPIATQKTITVNGVTQKLNDNPTFTVSATGVEVDPLSVHITDSAAMLFPYLRKNDAASLYYPLSNPAGYISSYTETDPLALAKTITVNGNTQPLSANPSFTVSGGTTLNGTGYVKMSGTTPSYIPQIGLTTDVTGILPIANGGTNNTSFTNGSLIYYNGTSFTENNSNLFWDKTNLRLGIGNASPSYALDVSGPSKSLGHLYNVQSKNSNYVLTGTDDVIKADASLSSITETLPSAIGISGQRFTIIKTDGTSNLVSIATTLSQTINGIAGYTLLNQNQFVTVSSDNANWNIVSSTELGGPITQNGDIILNYHGNIAGTYRPSYRLAWYGWKNNALTAASMYIDSSQMASGPVYLNMDMAGTLARLEQGANSYPGLRVYTNLTLTSTSDMGIHIQKNTGGNTSTIEFDAGYNSVGANSATQFTIKHNSANFLVISHSVASGLANDFAMSGATGKIGLQNSNPTAFLQLSYGTQAAATAPLKFTPLVLASVGGAGTGTSVHIDYNTQAAAPFAAGSTIVVSGIVPSAYNGTWTVTSSTTNTVNFNSTATGAITQQGTITANALMTIPENGAMEYDTTNLYMTTGGVRQKIITDQYATFLNAITTTGEINAIVTKTSAYAITGLDEYINADASSAAYNITLPTASGRKGQKYTIKKIDASPNNVTIVTTSSQTIDGASNYILSARWKYVSVISDGSNWLVTGNN